MRAAQSAIAINMHLGSPGRRIILPHYPGGLAEQLAGLFV
jgi:hypothetical protein